MPKRKVQADEAIVPVAPVLPPDPQARHVVIGDLHLRRTDPLGVIEPDGLNSRLKDKLQALNYAVQFALDNQATHIDLLGDVFEALNPPERLKRLFWDALAPAIAKNLKVTILIGNHDTTGELHNFDGDAVIAPPNVTIVKNNIFVTDEVGGGVLGMYLPYLHREDLLKKFEQERTKMGTPTVVFGHFEVQGAELAPDNSVIREGLERQVFDGVPVVLSGHIHKFQELRPGMAYVGSCVKCDFGEVNNRKVFAVLDMTVKGPVVHYFDIPQRPMYQISIMESDQENLYLEDKIPTALQQPGILLKFVLEGSAEWVDSLDKQRFKRRFPQALRVQFEEKKWDTDRQKTALVTSNIIDRVHEYVKSKNKGQDFLDAGVLIAKEAQEIDL